MLSRCVTHNLIKNYISYVLFISRGGKSEIMFRSCLTRAENEMIERRDGAWNFY